MRDHYRGFSHPVVADLPLDPTMNLFDEMDQIADECRANAEHIEGDDQIAFRQRQRKRFPNLSNEEFHNVFAVWREHYQARRNAQEIEKRERIAKLCEQRDELFAERAVAPAQQHATLTARLAEIGRELAELEPRFPAAPLGEWV
jgi:hypothetical protein